MYWASGHEFSAEFTGKQGGRWVPSLSLELRVHWGLQRCDENTAWKLLRMGSMWCLVQLDLGMGGKENGMGWEKAWWVRGTTRSSVKQKPEWESKWQEIKMGGSKSWAKGRWYSFGRPWWGVWALSWDVGQEWGKGGLTNVTQNPGLQPTIKWQFILTSLLAKGGLS